MKKLLLIALIFALYSTTAQAQNEETREILATCMKDAFSDNPEADEDVAKAADETSACIKKELRPRINALFEKNSAAKQKLLATINQTEKNISTIYNIIGNDNKYCHTYGGCDKLIIPARQRLIFLEGVLNFVITNQEERIN